MPGEPGRYTDSNAMDELAVIGSSAVQALLICSVWLVPLLIYRKIRGIPLIPDHPPIDMKSRRERNRLMFSVVGTFGISVYLFLNGSVITAGFFLAMALLALMLFEHLDRTNSRDVEK